MMIAKLLLVVALACAANAGEDLDLSFKLLKCLRRVIIAGLPAVHIPPHQPLVLNRNFSWHGDIGIASATLDVSNLVWANIPDWDVSATQLSEDNEPFAVFDYEISWKHWVMSSQYDLETNIALIPGRVSGDLQVTWDVPVWAGRINFTKPGFNEAERINSLELKWTLDDIHFDFTGLGIGELPVAAAFSNLVKTFLNTGVMGNAVGDALQTRLNTVWFEHNDRIDKILAWCAANPEN